MEMAGTQPLSSMTDKNGNSLLDRAANRAGIKARSIKIKRPAGYSRYVSFMKFLLPAIALGLLALIFLWPQIKVSDSRFSISFKSLQGTNTDDPNMINARFVGTDNKNQPFSITADLAKNIVLGRSAIELEMPKADIGINDGTWLVVTASSGLYNQKGKTLDLIGAVNLFHDSGYEFNTEKANIDLGKGIAISKEKITGQGPFGNLTAEGFRIENKGHRFIFTGKSKLVIHPQAGKK
jgi:lipopolysaccharide export system protein LptC